VRTLFGEGHRPSVISIVATLNEEEGVVPTLEELQQHLGSIPILIVDGRSHDRTVRLAKDFGADVIFQPGKGKGDAVAEAIRHVSRDPRYSEADLEYVVLTDADYTYPAEYLEEMLDTLERNPEIGMVCGNRFNSRNDLTSMTNIFYCGNRALAFTHDLLNGVNLRDPLTGLRIVRWSILRDWVPKSKGFDIEVELNHRVEKRGYGIKEIDIKYRPRLGEKKLKLRHGLTILRRILKGFMEEFARAPTT
jgi:glycosyltransferase involved in cell wall biosynthesis